MKITTLNPQCTVSRELCVKKNPVNQPSSSPDLVAQFLEHTTGVTEVVGSIPTWNSEVSSIVPSSVAKQP